MKTKVSLQAIKGSLLKDHYYLTDDDQCFFIGTYTAREPATFSKINRFILNLKKPLARKNYPDWSYKDQAIKEAANLILSLESWPKMQKYTWVPVPSSLVRGDFNYDDRLVSILQTIKSTNPPTNSTFDFRELILQKTNRVAAHGSISRPKPQDLLNNLYLNESLLPTNPTGFIIFDDVIVTGASFKAMKQILSTQFPGIPIYGFFLARNIWNANPDLA